MELGAPKDEDCDEDLAHDEADYIYRERIYHWFFYGTQLLMRRS